MNKTREKLKSRDALNLLKSTTFYFDDAHFARETGRSKKKERKREEERLRERARERESKDKERREED